MQCFKLHTRTLRADKHYIGIVCAETQHLVNYTYPFTVFLKTATFMFFVVVVVVVVVVETSLNLWHVFQQFADTHILKGLEICGSLSWKIEKKEKTRET